ncbi:hypothetical protein [Tropicimonas sediminicola]|uniref:Uncharacterized protein n=1 Tax=Tropicimonas sediminicola TaxID=1031541 RepID=A0A239KGA7_9RHOB|nr:hypothetical protein [Tropicimonas sediminicola]SNT17020.1 hypothetical protein SAMN05421757_10786 [Tropicimonas sediminicola]
MSVVESLLAAAESFDAVPAEARILRKSKIHVGPGGAWRAGVWYIGFRRLRAVMIPVGNGLPVALTPVFASAQTAAEVAEAHAAMAAELSGTAVITTEDDLVTSGAFLEDRVALNRQLQ